MIPYLLVSFFFLIPLENYVAISGHMGQLQNPEFFFLTFSPTTDPGLWVSDYRPPSTSSTPITDLSFPSSVVRRLSSAPLLLPVAQPGRAGTKVSEYQCVKVSKFF